MSTRERRQRRLRREEGAEVSSLRLKVALEGVGREEEKQAATSEQSRS